LTEPHFLPVILTCETGDKDWRLQSDEGVAKTDAGRGISLRRWGDYAKLHRDEVNGNWRRDYADIREDHREQYRDGWWRDRYGRWHRY
jgi:hypothetical protein